jgi:RHS repeat-associated protein
VQYRLIRRLLPLWDGQGGTERKPRAGWYQIQITEKERDVESLYDYFGARYYDARIGRWLAVDPLEKRYPALSSYHFVLNNPLNFIDAHGDSSSERQWWQVASDALFGGRVQDRIFQLVGDVKQLFGEIMGIGEGPGLQQKSPAEEDAERGSNPAHVTRQEVAAASLTTVEDIVDVQVTGVLASTAIISSLAGGAAAVEGANWLAGAAISAKALAPTLAQDYMTGSALGKRSELSSYRATGFSLALAGLSSVGRGSLGAPLGILSAGYSYYNLFPSAQTQLMHKSRIYWR